ncbi:hypothetical protein TUM20985_11910 [Mycobacterium antarcticum]|nr:hypothetical protein TUM20985_11910 [Mycolicibacterium sp. TUM20985]
MVCWAVWSACATDGAMSETQAAAAQVAKVVRMSDGRTAPPVFEMVIHPCIAVGTGFVAHPALAVRTANVGLGRH